MERFAQDGVKIRAGVAVVYAFALKVFDRARRPDRRRRAGGGEKFDRPCPLFEVEIVEILSGNRHLAIIERQYGAFHAQFIVRARQFVANYLAAAFYKRLHRRDLLIAHRKNTRHKKHLERRLILDNFA
jgi:hypothetical protein